jgi:hypothetical protein
MATGTTSSTLLIVIVLIHGTVAVTALFLGVTEVAVAALAGISLSAAAGAAHIGRIRHHDGGARCAPGDRSEVGTSRE